MNINTIIIGGNLTADPEIRKLPSGKSVCDMSLASNDGKGEKQQTCFISCVAFEKTAELCARYLEKGASAVFEGKLLFDQWDDKETGKKRSKHKVLVARVHFGSRPKSTSTEDNAAADDSLPF